jgi:Nif11 domain
MSKENVALFIKAANKKPELNARLVQKARIDDWLKIAREAGFEFTAAEFCSAIEGTINKKVTPENVVKELLAAQKAVGSGEISKRALETVVGGVGVEYVTFEPLFLEVEPPRPPLHLPEDA